MPASANMYMHSFRLPLNFPNQATLRFVRDPDICDVGIWGDIPSLAAGLYKAGVNQQEFHWSHFSVDMG